MKRQKYVIFVEKEYQKSLLKIKVTEKSEIIVIITGKCRGAVHSICNLKLNVPNEIPVVFYRGSNYDCYFIIKEFANEFEREFECLEENKEKNKTFSVPVKKEIVKIDKEGNKSLTK